MYKEIIQNIVQEWTLFNPTIGPLSPPPHDFVTEVSREISRFSQAPGSPPAFSLQGKWIVATSSADIPHPFDLHDLAIIMGFILRDRQGAAEITPSPRHDCGHRDVVFANAMKSISFPGLNFR
ncbi:hypothetical protein N5W20_08955 [Candidatus Kirkpatrickella diaphorinae]|uniref:Uncharacterized protein n=1 Tax=Candidatus Kirkpatrickella diaphorinae TaxID=2984322 RepID=A0ABY6GJK6_9PROT|nr:hypothetical protein [Candidatus Kirkpatrickella diaphorinae]UYH51201.1 hypothetical protein N5W20_08955 [Candidatus Kirkpatrickella diaphorinae]